MTSSGTQHPPPGAGDQDLGGQIPRRPAMVEPLEEILQEARPSPAPARAKDVNPKTTKPKRSQKKNEAEKSHSGNTYMKPKSKRKPPKTREASKNHSITQYFTSDREPTTPSGTPGPGIIDGKGKQQGIDN